MQKSKKKKNKIDMVNKILNKIKNKGSIHNGTKRKQLSFCIIGGIVIAGTALTGGVGAAIGGAVGSWFGTALLPTFGTALSKLPVGSVVDVVADKAGKINVGYTTMSKGLWQNLGNLPSRYEQIESSSKKYKSKRTHRKRLQDKNRNTNKD